MARISDLYIENFRNIGKLHIHLNNGISVVNGRNGKGKSTIVCGAIPWLLGNTNLTDKWGTGENDVEDNIPIGMDANDTMSVQVVFEDGVSYTKSIKAKVDKNGKITGYPVTYKKNLTEYTKTKWTEDIYQEIGFTPFFADFKKEINLYFDMLDALQKRDPKDLRKLLINLGCDVSVEEAFNVVGDRYDVSSIRNDLHNYNNDIYALRKEYKKLNSASGVAVDKLRTQLEPFNDVQVFDENSLASIDAELKEKRQMLFDESIRDVKKQTIEIDAKIDVLKKADETAQKIKKLEYETKISTLEKELSVEKKLIESRLEDESKDLRNKLAETKIDVASASSMKKAYEQSLSNIEQQINATSDIGRSITKQMNKAVVDLEDERNKTFNDYIDCPICGSQFVLNPTAESIFKKKHQDEMIRLENDVEHYKEQRCKTLTAFENLKIQKVKTESELKKATDSYNELVKKTYDLEMSIKSIMNKPKDETKIHYIENEINDLYESIRQVKSIPANEEIAILEKQKLEITTEANKYVELRKAELQMEIDNLEIKRTGMLVERSRYNDKLNLKNKLAEAIAYRNDMEEQVLIVNEVVKTLIRMCNDKAKNLTGFDFVMLEENLGNDNVTEVCYMLVDGVPFGVVNTSQKFIYGIKFIKKMKDILERDFGIKKNDVPILFDKIESIDAKTLEENKEVFEGCQIICTRVTNDENLVITEN